ncbi:hypothetical protein [Paenibacillus zanthoxyli]|nr:hypothetical protein [Paenibacillus zanthoxyli]
MLISYKMPMNLYQAGLLVGNVSVEKRVGERISDARTALFDFF